MSDFNPKTDEQTAKSASAVLGLKFGLGSALLLSFIMSCSNPIAKPSLASRTGSDAQPATDEPEGDDTEEVDSEDADVVTNNGAQTTSGGTTTGTGTQTGTGTTTQTGTGTGTGTTTQVPPTDGTPAIGSTDNGWKLVWSDEFNGTTLDETKWTYEVQKPGWVNNELQNYTNKRKENVRLENGHLVIEARKDKFEGHDYSSGRIKTQAKHSWKYGRIEARMQLPGGLGTWPAFWMMPEDQSKGWPLCGEIDIMEEVGFEQDAIHATVHTAKYNWANNNVKTASVPTAGVTTGYHTYTMEWYEDHMDGFVDGKKYFTVKNEGTGEDSWPFNKNFHVIFNLAVGGVWGGMNGVDANIWPRAMLVDWVRVYQK
ncbi:MAG: glycoside hydrolase family 16 protein [Proteobacteria bacterium]|nr:MAG: glycoside hydrolase family 16 protein [Pseudomonadota bacterium]